MPAVIPEPPAPVAVRLDPAATALLIFDMSDLLCAAVPACRATISRVVALLARARQAGVPVIFSLGRAPQRLLREMQARPDEPVVSSGADKFFHTDLERHLAGRTVALMAGTSSNGSIIYTALATCARGLTVVVAEDTISSKLQVANAVARWQLLNQPGYPNRENAPLAPNAVTLSRSDLVSFSSASQGGTRAR